MHTDRPCKCKRRPTVNLELAQLHEWTDELNGAACKRFRETAIVIGALWKSDSLVSEAGALLLSRLVPMVAEFKSSLRETRAPARLNITRVRLILVFS